MLLKLIKMRQEEGATYCELWEINHLTGDKQLAQVLVSDDQMPLELIYRLSVTGVGLSIQGKRCRWQWLEAAEEILVMHYLRAIQHSREEIRIEVGRPKPYLPGYPETDYHPCDFYDCELAVGLEMAMDIPDE